MLKKFFPKKPPLAPELVPEKGQISSACCNAKMYAYDQPSLKRRIVYCGNCLQLMDNQTREPKRPADYFKKNNDAHLEK